MGLSNVEDILQAGLDGTDLPRPESRIAELLKEWIEQGGNIDDILVAGTNITLTKNADGTITIAASGEVSSEDTVARAEIAEIKDGETLDSFGDVETALGSKQNTISDLSTIRDGAALGATAVQPKTGKDLSTNDYTDAEKTKLAGIETQANKTTVDDSLSGSSTNPVQNKVIKSALEGKADITDIPTVPITAIQKNGTGITPVSGTVNITVPTTATDVSALSDTTKYAAALSLTINSSTFVMTGQLKDQNGDNLGTAQTIDLPLESVVVGGSYNSQTKKVVLRLQNGNTIEFSVADLVSGLQTELSASNKLNPAYISYDSTHRAVSDTEKSTWNGKQSALTTAQLAAVNSGIDNTKVAQIELNENNISLVYDECGAEKNALRFDGFNLTAGNVNGVSYRLNADKSITVNGKPSGTSPSYTYLYWKNNPLYIDNLCNGEYVLSGCPDGGSDSTFKMYVAKGTYTKTDYGNGVELTSTSETGILFVIYIHNSYTANNLTFKPMICKKELWEVSHKYEPNNTNKVCECFGDSLTWYDGNAFTWGARQGDICVGFESYLRDYLNLTVHNNGVMGETTPEICTRIKNAASSTIIAADYITVMGGDNDDRLSVAVGTIAPSGSNFDTTTVIGALQSAIETTLATNARARIVLMTEPMGWTYKNSTMTRVSEDYPNAYRAVAEYYGLPLIDNWKLSGINEATRAAYMADPISENTNYIYHPSNEGWRRISKTICDTMKTL